MKRFFGTTRTADDDCPETQYATENSLSNPYAFDLAEQSLQRVAANQACLNQHTLVCDSELGSHTLDYGVSPVTSTPTIKMSERNFAMLPPEREKPNSRDKQESR